MFNKIKSKFNGLSGEEPHFEQAVILESDFDSGLEFGHDNERRQVLDLEEALAKIIEPAGEVDGHDFGEYMFTVYLYGKSADDLYEKIKETLRKSTFNRFEVTLQYGPPQDPNTQEKKFTFS